MKKFKDIVIPRVVPFDLFKGYLDDVRHYYPNRNIIVLETNLSCTEKYKSDERVIHYHQGRYSPGKIHRTLENNSLDKSRLEFVIPYVEKSYLEYGNLIRLEKALGIRTYYLNDEALLLDSSAMRLRFGDAYHRLRDDKRRIRSLKNTFKGKRCFVLGNGPSLGQIDLGYLKNEFTFGSNGIFHAFKDIGKSTTFYTVEDELCAKDNFQTIQNIKDSQLMFYPLRLYPYFKSLEKALFLNYVPSSKEERIFSPDPSKVIYSGYTVVYLNLQIANYLGFDKIYTLGIDLSYDFNRESDSIKFESDGNHQNHFSPDYYSKGHSWWRPEVEQMVISLKEAARSIHKSGGEIFNATPGGNLNFLPRVKYDSLFTGEK